MASRPPTVRSFYRSLPPPGIIEPVPEIPPIDLAAISIVEPVIEPVLVATPPPPPALEIISLERVDRTNLPAHVPRSWRYSISRWAYRWWLWTREAFRHCFPTSKQH